jgi:hypothetical protein
MSCDNKKYSAMPHVVRLATVGAAFGAAVTVTLAVPVFPLLAAVTVNGPPAVPPAVNRPPLEIDPPPETVQTNVAVMVLLN